MIRESVGIRENAGREGNRVLRVIPAVRETRVTLERRENRGPLVRKGNLVAKVREERGEREANVVKRVMMDVKESPV